MGLSQFYSVKVRRFGLIEILSVLGDAAKLSAIAKMS
jgi:hypothetical protein